MDKTLDNIKIARPEPTEETPQHLCLDKGFDYEAVLLAIAARQYEDTFAAGANKLQPNERLKAIAPCAFLSKEPILGSIAFAVCLAVGKRKF